MLEGLETNPRGGKRKHNGEILPGRTDRPTTGIPFLRAWSYFLLKKGFHLERFESKEVDSAYLSIQKPAPSVYLVLPPVSQSSKQVLPTNKFNMILYLVFGIKKFYSK